MARISSFDVMSFESVVLYFSNSADAENPLKFSDFGATPLIMCMIAAPIILNTENTAAAIGLVAASKRSTKKITPNIKIPTIQLVMNRLTP